MSQGSFDPTAGDGGHRPNVPNHLVKAILVTLFICQSISFRIGLDVAVYFNYLQPIGTGKEQVP